MLDIKIKINLTILVMMMTMTTRIEGHTKISGPKWFVHSGEVNIHASERLHGVLIRFDPQVSHLA